MNEIAINKMKNKIFLTDIELRLKYLREINHYWSEDELYYLNKFYHESPQAEYFSIDNGYQYYLEKGEGDIDDDVVIYYNIKFIIRKVDG